MKKAALTILVLFSIGAAQADVTVSLDPSANWIGYMTVFNTPAQGGAWLWGSQWGTADLRASFEAGTYYLNLGANTNCWAPGDLYWVTATGQANKSMEATFMREFGTGYEGQNIHFSFEVVSNNLAAAGYTTTGFIKTLNPGTGWSVVDLAQVDLTVGTKNLNATVSPIPGLVLQVGFTVKGLVANPASPTAALGVKVRVPGGTPALFPVPAVNTGFPASSTTVSWTNPDPNQPADTVTAAAYLLASDVELTDPNLGPDVFEPGVVPLTVNALDDYESASVSLSVNKYYYWTVHVTDSGTGITVPGFIWNFQTFDSPPSIVASADQYIEATAKPKTINIGSVVTDDKPGYAIQWTDITAAGDKDPATTVTINGATTANPTVTFNNSTGEIWGYYQFQVTVTDTGNQTATDQVIVGIFGTCAEAAVSDPGDNYDPTGDLNMDCRKDLSDFAILAADWLECNANRITCP